MYITAVYNYYYQLTEVNGNLRNHEPDKVMRETDFL